MDPSPVAATDDSRPGFGPWGWLVVALAALPFLPGVFDAGWVYDDARFIVVNEHVTSPTSWLAFFTDPGTVDAHNLEAIVRPLRTFEFALDHALFGLAPTAFRLHSLAWHLLATAGVFTLLRGLLGGGFPAVFATLVWAVHPVQVESVTWISSRGDVAMGACFVWSLVAARRSRGWDAACALSLGLAALAVLYKETAIVLPVCVFALRLVPARRPAVSLPAAARSALPWIAVAALYMAYRGAVADLGTDHVRTFVLGGSTAGTFATMFRGLGLYLLSVLVPTRQAMDWFLPPSTTLADPAALAWLAVHVALIQRAIAWRVRHPERTLAVVLFYVALVPVANWPFWLGIPTAERFLYVPLVGCALGLGLALRALSAPGAARAVGAVSIACLATLTALRTRVWSSDDALWANEVRTHATARGEEWDGNRRQKRARELLAMAQAASDTGTQERNVALAQEETRLAAAAYHREIAIWQGIEGRARPLSYPLLEPENNLAAIALSFDEPAHALYHARRSVALIEAHFVPEARAEQPYRLQAQALLRVGLPLAAVASMRRAVERGFDATSLVGAFWCGAAVEALVEEQAFAAADEVAGWSRSDIRDEARRTIEEARARLRQQAAGERAPRWRAALARARAGDIDEARALWTAPDTDTAEGRSAVREWTRLTIENRADDEALRAARAVYLRLATDDAASALAALACAVAEGERASVESALTLVRGHDAATQAAAEALLARTDSGCPALDVRD